MSQLLTNKTNLQAILESVNSLPKAGTELPELTNSAVASEVISGKEFINWAGEKVTGSFTIDNELTAQDSLIAQIQEALVGKAIGGSSSNEYAIIIKVASESIISPAVYIDGEIICYSAGTVLLCASPGQTITLTSSSNSNIYSAKTFHNLDVSVYVTNTLPYQGEAQTIYYHSFEMPSDHVICSTSLSNVHFLA